MAKEMIDMRQSNTHKKIFFQEDKCNGCMICELRCTFFHFQVFSLTKARLKVDKKDIIGRSSIYICRQCHNTPCISACPQNALSQDDTTGAILVNQELCVGCGECIKACPFNAIGWDRDNNTPLICDLCNGNPQCVQYCPEEVFFFGTAKEYAERIKKVGDKAGK
ncbi:MAG: 4Fe-4S dicluster domain-containing protein [Candidatus Heimdallarchaeaceae archaeon]